MADILNTLNTNQRYLDYAGLQSFWAKVKTYLESQIGDSEDSVKGYIDSLTVNGVKVDNTGITPTVTITGDNIQYDANDTVTGKIDKVEGTLGEHTSTLNTHDSQITAIMGEIGNLGGNLESSVVKQLDVTSAEDGYISVTVDGSPAGEGSPAKTGSVTITVDETILGETMETIADNFNNMAVLTINEKSVFTKSDSGVTANNITLFSADIKLDETENVSVYDVLDGLNTKIGALTSATSFEGVVTWNPAVATIEQAAAGSSDYKITVDGELKATLQNGDIIIFGAKEYILSVPSAGDPSFVELGDTTAEADAISSLNGWVTSNAISEADINKLFTDSSN